ncbi:hypothetical protein SBA3_3000028 [Candidatus Sulfopaludibacter sp. SbA3]|nr:hypothetical protein SBA3_3000028 [Candidatus Sulfopaludibacter sp. SbA3]
MFFGTRSQTVSEAFVEIWSGADELTEIPGNFDLTRPTDGRETLSIKSYRFVPGVCVSLCSSRFRDSGL